MKRRYRHHQYVGAFVTAADVTVLHAAIAAQVTDLGNAVAQCTTPAGLALSDEWHAMRERAIAYLADEPSTLRAASQMNAGEQLQRDLQPWYAKLRQAGCTSVPTPPEAPEKPPSLASIVSDVEPIVLMVLAFFVLREFKK